VIGALLSDKLITVDLFDESVNKNTFSAWLEQSLIPILDKEYVIVMDNASFHKGKEIKKIITDAGHILEYLPTYSPDLNPIEQKWAQAKSIRRKYNCSINSLFTYYL
jgi:transposase